jgi:hypothetical protein
MLNSEHTCHVIPQLSTIEPSQYLDGPPSTYWEYWEQLAHIFAHPA